MSTCYLCNGKGYVPNPKESFHQQCSRCRGDGFLTGLPGLPYAYRRATAQGQCPDCHGTGYANVIICAHCNGKGWIEDQTYSYRPIRSTFPSSSAPRKSKRFTILAILWFFLIGPTLSAIAQVPVIAMQKQMEQGYVVLAIIVIWGVIWIGGTFLFLLKAVDE